MSQLETTLEFQMKAAGLPAFEREYRFHPPRRWRFDFAFTGSLLAVECEGGIWTNGRHVRARGFSADIEKYNQAVLNGWRVLRFTGDMIKSGVALNLIEEALK